MRVERQECIIGDNLIHDGCEKGHLLGTVKLINSISSQKTSLEITCLAESTGINATSQVNSI